MTSAQRQRVKELFDEAFELAPAEQARLLDNVRIADPTVCAEVEALLQQHCEASVFLETPVNELFDWPDEASLAGLHPGREIGPYRLTSELGSGGMGAVYLAERIDGVHQQPVALKLVWPTGGREMIERFHREREILARLNHPNIARLHDGGTTPEGWPYLVMEYVAGEPLTTYCRTHRLTIIERLNLFRTVCDAVQYAHRNLIVHRDLKPTNILVTADGVPKLLDFGIAKLLEGGHYQATLTSGGVQPFTPLYASPEQIRNEPITTASDVYSLGVLLYELLTGTRPYGKSADSLTEQMRAVTETEPPRPSVHLAELRGDLDNITLKALHKDLAPRYATADQLSDDLLRHLNGEPVTARPATRRYRVGKYVQRHRAFVTMASLLALTLLMVAIVTGLQLRASRSREREQRYQLYAADMRQTGADWSAGNLVQMDALLERHRPGTRSDEWRGFEWFALWKLLHTEKFTLPHQTWVPTVIYTPDGKTILTGSRDGRIEMWDARSGQSLGLFATFSEGVYKLLISNDGKKLVAGGYFGQIGIWDYSSRRMIAELPSAIVGFASPTLSPDGKRVALKAIDQPIRVYDTDTGQLTAEYLLPLKLDVVKDGPALYAPDGRLFCLTRKDGQWELWDVVTGRTVSRFDPQSKHSRALTPYDPTGYLFSSDGQRFYLPTRDFLTRVWDISSGKLLHVFTGHQDNVETPALSSDGKLLATGSDDRTLRSWDTQTGKLLTTVRNESQTFSPVFSPDNKYLAAVCMRALRVKVWEVAQLRAGQSVFDGVSYVALAPDGKSYLANNKASGQMVMCDLSSGQQIFAYPKIDANAASLSPDGKQLAFSGRTDQSMVEVLEIVSGKTLAILKGHRSPVTASDFSPDGRTLAIAGTDRVIKLWDTANWRERANWQGHADKIPCVSFSPDSSKLATGSYDTTTKVWDVASGKELLTLRGHRAWVFAVKFSPDGKLLASASWDYTAKLWDTATGRELRTLTGHANSVYAVAFSPDGRRLATGSDDQTVRLWDVATGALLATLHGHTGPVWQVAFTPDGQTLFSSSAKETRVWRAATMADVQARQSR